MVSLQARHAHLAEMGVPQWYSRLNLLGAASSPSFIVGALEDIANPSVLLDSSSLISEAKLLLDAQHPPETSSKSGSQSVHAILGAVKEDVDESLSGPVSERNAVKSELIGEGALPAGSAHDVLPVIGNEAVGRNDSVSPQLAGVANSVVADGSINSEISALKAFSLQVYKIPGCLVVTESDGGSEQVLEISLLQNIMNASHLVPKGEFESRQAFHWPIFDSSNLQGKQNPQLKAILEAWFVANIEPGEGVILYFGSDFSSVKSLLKVLASSRYPSLEAMLSFQFSLSELLRLPARKAEVWRQVVEHRAL
jgi:hypothetical protein